MLLHDFKGDGLISAHLLEDEWMRLELDGTLALDRILDEHAVQKVDERFRVLFL